MTDQPKMSKEEAILELRREAQELEDAACSLSSYARNSQQARIRRDLADKFERELENTKPENK